MAAFCARRQSEKKVKNGVGGRVVQAVARMFRGMCLPGIQLAIRLGFGWASAPPHSLHIQRKVLTRHGKARILIPAENAPLPQLDRGTDYESVRRGFESLTAHHLKHQAGIGSRFRLFCSRRLFAGAGPKSCPRRGLGHHPFGDSRYPARFARAVAASCIRSWFAS